MADKNPAAVRFGRALSSRRKKAGLTQATVANMVGVSGAHISHLETGVRTPVQTLLPHLDRVLETDGQLERLWDELTGSGREAWLDEVDTLIREANAVYDYQLMVFPAYLQTEAYARALVRYGAPWLTPGQVAAKVSERAEKARLVGDAERPLLWSVVDQTVLGRRYGSAQTQFDQLSHLAHLVESERVTLQFIPAGSTRHPGVSGSFNVICSDGPDVAYAESVHEGQVISAANHVANYRMLFGALQSVATDPGDTLHALREEMKRLEYEQQAGMAQVHVQRWDEPLR